MSSYFYPYDLIPFTGYTYEVIQAMRREHTSYIYSPSDNAPYLAPDEYQAHCGCGWASEAANDDQLVFCALKAHLRAVRRRDHGE